MKEKLKEIHRTLHLSLDFKVLHNTEDFQKIDKMLDELMA